MTIEAADLWKRAQRALRTAQILSADDPDAAASRAYYAAFYAVSALFTLEGLAFRKHTAVAAAVHRELVKTGRCPAEVGMAYTALLLHRATGDYGGSLHVTAEASCDAVTKAQRVLAAVERLSPELSPEA